MVLSGEAERGDMVRHGRAGALQNQNIENNPMQSKKVGAGGFERPAKNF
jgi:hypothetical protein